MFENDFGGNVDSTHEGVRGDISTERGEVSVNAEDGNINGEGEGAFAGIREARTLKQEEIHNLHWSHGSKNHYR